MRLLSKFINTILYYCQGKGNPFRLILVWYILLNVIALTVGFLALFSSRYLSETGWLVNKMLAVLILLVVGFLGQMITFIYPLIFVYALWKCSFNVKWEPLGFIVAFLMFPFLFAHFVLGTLYFNGSGMMILVAWKVIKAGY